MRDTIFFAMGILCAAFGAELFVRGTLGFGRALRIAPGLVAATMGALATSSPELTVAVTSALEGAPQISLGNALGSNVVNIAFILAIALLLAPIDADRGSIRRDFSFAVLTPLLLLFVLADGRLTRTDSLLLLAAFTAWMALCMAEARQQRSLANGDAETGLFIPALLSLGGLAFLMAGGQLIVHSGQSMALRFGLSEYVVGATIVSIGTTVPELGTVLLSRLRGHHDISLGTLVGSNIINGLLIVGIAGAISPYDVAISGMLVTLGFGFLAVLLIYPPANGPLSRRRGLALLALYVAHLALLLNGETRPSQ
jgi:cation:H+ antiporter